MQRRHRHVSIARSTQMVLVMFSQFFARLFDFPIDLSHSMQCRVLREPHRPHQQYYL